MKPMRPMDFGPAWWPEDLGRPAARAAGLRYAFFPDRRRLAIRRDGEVTLHDSGDHRVSGVLHKGGDGGPPAATAPEGSEVELDRLEVAG